MVCTLMASRSSLPNAFGAQIPVPSQLNVSQWETLLEDYTEKHWKALAGPFDISPFSSEFVSELPKQQFTFSIHNASWPMSIWPDDFCGSEKPENAFIAFKNLAFRF